MATYTPFFDLFPKVQYDINRSQYPVYETTTDIFFRLAILKNVLNNTSSYYAYDIDGNDTPEIVAEKVYGDSGAGWIIIYANQILDPQFDWVLDDKAFNRYIEGKYGSVETAQTTYHHYEKVIQRTINEETTETRFQIDEAMLTDNDPTVPYDDYTDLAASSSNTYNILDTTITEVVKKEAITNYDYESQLNDSRRQIKVIKKEYYTRIIQEFRNIVGNTPSFIRTVR